MSKNQGLTRGGFTIILNELLEALILAKISSTQLRICLHILRVTNGWRREWAAVSLQDFAAACDSSKSWISQQIQDLVNRSIIIRIESIGQKAVFKINPNIAEWNIASLYAYDMFSNQENDLAETEQLSSHLTDDFCSQVFRDNETGGLRDNERVPFCDHERVPFRDNERVGLCDNETPPPSSSLEVEESQPQLKKGFKENIKKDKEREFTSEDTLYFTLAKLLLDKILYHVPEFKPPDLQKWAEAMKEIIETDKRNPETVRRVIIFSQSDPFWQYNILDAGKLREKFDNVNAKRLSRSGKSLQKKYNEYDIYLRD